MKVTLLRAMCFAGVRQEAGSEAEVSDSLARELIAQKRAEPVGGGTLPPPAGPMTTESAGVLVGEPAKGKRNARS